MPRTRLAPSPTGALHLGNARTFLINWALARQRGWEVLLRIEDLDSPRIKAGADLGAIADLAWLGLDWDEGPVYQTAELAPCRQAIECLSRAGLLYPCACTRREIEQAQSAPHEVPGQELRYPGTCRPEKAAPLPRHVFTPDPSADGGAAPAIRIRVPDEPVVVHDQVRGVQRINVQATVGDFIIATRAGLPAYQLAVVVDDARQGMTDVVRGDDLLGSTARQLWLYRYLGVAAPPRWWHLPLLLGPDGRRLAKRHGDSRLARYREMGVPVERIVGLLAHWSGVTARREPMSVGDFAARFDIGRLPGEAVTFTPEDESWLVADHQDSLNRAKTAGV